MKNFVRRNNQPVLSLQPGGPSVDVRSAAARIAEHMAAPLTEIGEQIQTLSEKADSLIQESERLLSLATGQHGGQAVLQETSDLLDDPLRFLNTWRSEMSTHEESLQLCAELLGNMLLAEQRLQTTISPLKHVQTMFKIEAAPLAEETRLIFAGLTEKIQSVHQRVEDTFIRQFHIVAENNAEIRSVLDLVHQENSRLDGMIQKHEAELRSSLAKLDREISENLNRDVRLRDVSKSIAADVNGMVVALQSQDIMSQKLEHLSKSSQQGSDAETMRGVEKLASSTHAALSRAIDKIEETVACVDQKCLGLSEFDEVTAAADGTIQVLLDTISTARALTLSAIELADRSGEKIQPASSTASTLIGALEVLAFEMHLIALNAQIQAVQIGRGTGLEVLAAHTANVSKTTEDLVKGVAADVERLAESLASLRQAFDLLAIEGRTQLFTLETNGVEQEKKLHALRDETLQKMLSVGATSDQIRQTAQDARKHLSEFQAVIVQIKTLTGEFGIIEGEDSAAHTLTSLAVAVSGATANLPVSEEAVCEELFAGSDVELF